MSEETLKTGNWFSRLSKTKKGVLIGGVIAIALISAYFILKPSADEEKKTISDELTNDSNEESADALNSKTESKVSKTNIGKPAPYTGKLPNDGKGCGDVKVAFDRDYDYVKCNGDWFVKSKQNPATVSTKGKYPDWVSLKANKVATERLNRRYAN
jgi:hypothetical protein